VKEMANSNNSNKKLVPEAMDALEKFKYEVASEVGVTLKDGYNGDISSRDAGRIGGNMVKKMIQQVENNMANK
jgi:small acid-soluble spore protein alpha/beta type